MNEVVRINLDNEMDLILAHKRCMKISELCGLPAGSQTRFATAVSEIARCAIANGQQSVLLLGIEVYRPTQKSIVAIIQDEVDLRERSPEAYAYARRISGNIEYEKTKGHYETTIAYHIPSPGLINDTKINGFKDYFRFEPAISPYDEIRKKNIELIALSEKLAESESKYKQLADTLPLLVFNVDQLGRVNLTNNWLNRYLGVPFTAFDRTVLAQVLFLDDLEKVLSEWDKIRKRGGNIQMEVRVKHEDQYYWHLLSVVPIGGDDGPAIRHWTGFLVDIDAQRAIESTRRDNDVLKEMREQLERANAVLQVKNRELQQFAFVASHDLQEPLRKIMIMASRALENMPQDESDRLYISKINAAAGRMSNLISDVLNYSRIADFSPSFSAVDLNEIIAEVQDDLTQFIEDRQAKLTVRHLPTVQGMHTMLKQLLFNLVSNALKFNSSQPVISISSTLVSAMDETLAVLPDGNYHRIEVADNGIGIDDKYSGKIFNMFQRLHAREAYGGNGIGLALCRTIAENHNGAIGFVSETGKGTTFKVWLPVSSEAMIGTP